MRLLSSAICAVALGVVLLGCGSGSSSTASAPRPVPGGAAATAVHSSPGWCRALTGSDSLLALGKAMTELAANHDEAAAKATIRRAAGALRKAAGAAPPKQRPALAHAAKAIGAIAARGLAQAAPAEHALTHAGHLVEKPCAFPVG
jgi:hypothetical protein